MGKLCYDCAHHDGDTKNGNTWCSYYRGYYDPRDADRCRRFELKKSSSNCYLTTLVCDILGFEDDCEVLETLRNFRDNYMRYDKDLNLLLDDYDIVGPQVCTLLEKDERKEEIATTMLNHFINPSINHINNNEYDEAVTVYEDMTLSLMNYYNLDSDNLNCARNNQRKRKFSE